MNTAPFYELHDRLYDCASAGCASIPEDFRLKRAVEGMAPLAEANKTFARLRDMCARLFTEPEPALLLADCIALADALAVAQGHYTNAEESQPGTLEYDVEYNMEAGWRSVKSLWAAILTKSQHLKKLDPDEYALLGDPRILEMFISASGEKGENISAFADTMCAAYGTSIVPLLKGSIDMSDEKASGVQVDYIANTAGSAENDWYLSLAENEEAPQNVRIKAIQALGRDSANALRLLDFCRTEKGRVKTAALLETARLNPPGFDDILTKLTAKYKDSYLPILCTSTSDVAVDFIRSRLDSAFSADKKNRPDPKQVMSTVSMMIYKPDIDDCFLRALEYSRKFPASPKGIYELREMNYVLINNMFPDPDGRFKAMTLRLHEKEPEAFFTAWCIAMLPDDPDKVAAEMKKRISRRGSYAAFHLLEDGIRYSESDGKYIFAAEVPVAYGDIPVRVLTMPLFARMPQSLTELLGESSMISGDSREMTYPVQARCNFLKTAIETAAPDDVGAIKEQTVKFALAAIKKIPHLDLLELIVNYGSPDSKTTFRLIRDCAMFPPNAPRSAYEVAKTPLLTVQQKRTLLLEMLDKVLTGPLSHFSTIARNLLEELPE